jgi:hypothetical protein
MPIQSAEILGGVLNNVLPELPDGSGSHGDFFVLVFFRLVQSVSPIFLCSTNATVCLAQGFPLASAHFDSEWIAYSRKTSP